MNQALEIVCDYLHILDVKRMAIVNRQLANRLKYRVINGHKRAVKIQRAFRGDRRFYGIEVREDGCKCFYLFMEGCWFQTLSKSRVELFGFKNFTLSQAIKQWWWIGSAVKFEILNSVQVREYIKESGNRELMMKLQNRDS